jgi:tRNA dimethylallyltransferase
MDDLLIVVTGPTAVGKTALCMEIAREYGLSVINADSRQIYNGMQIGTAAPSAEQMGEVEHFFVGALSLDDYYNASMFEQDALRVIGRQFALQDPKGRRRALMSGGSMMYIDAVCKGIDDIPTITEETRAMVKERLGREGLESLCEELHKLDPDYYDIVDRHNTRRVVHGLEICFQTGQTYTSFRKRQPQKRPFKVATIVLNRPREELYQRINSRVDSMMQSGLLEEAKRLYCHRHLNALNTVGYKEMFAYLDGTYSLDEAVERIKGNTRRYARKQLTWFKKYEDARWFNPSDTNEIMNYISQL